MIGIVTESDIVKKVIGSDRGSYFILVEDIMSSPIVGIEERRPITEAADMMNYNRTRHLGMTKRGSSWAPCWSETSSNPSPSTNSSR